jgi:DNA-binding CsgD family transcriptional regulator
LKNKDLTLLTSQDLQDIFNIIHIANCQLSLSEMRTRVGRSLRETFDANGVVFFLGDKDLKAIDNANLAGIDVDLHYLNQWVRYFCHDDPFQQRPFSRSPVCKVDDLLPYHRWVNLRIYNEFYRPQNIHYKLSISLRSSNKVLGLIGIFRTREQQDFSGGEMAKARILAPHLTTALENVFFFSGMDEGRHFPEGRGNRSPLFGVLILDDHLRPVYWSSEAKEFCQMLCRIQQASVNKAGVEDLPLPYEILQDCSTLQKSLQSGDQLASYRRRRTMAAGPSRRFQVISSLFESSSREDSSFRFVVYLMDDSGNGKTTGETLRDQYLLTKREVDIVRCVCQGLTNDEIGEKLYISRFTVETHLKNIFDKTKVKHRAGLAGLLQPL